MTKEEIQEAWTKKSLELLKQWELIDIIVDMEKEIECLKKKLKK